MSRRTGRCARFLFMLVQEGDRAGGRDASHPPTQEGEEGKRSNFLHAHYKILVLSQDETVVKVSGQVFIWHHLSVTDGVTFV